MILFYFAEEPYYGSGSGSGGGSIEESGEEGSGMGAIDYTPGINEAGPSTTHPINPVILSGTGSAPDTSDKDSKTPVDPNKSNKINEIDSNSINDKSSGSSAVGTTSQMSLKRALFTYFLPIYLAWFGGLFSELL